MAMEKLLACRRPKPDQQMTNTFFFVCFVKMEFSIPYSLFILRLYLQISSRRLYQRKTVCWRQTTIIQGRHAPEKLHYSVSKHALMGLRKWTSISFYLFHCLWNSLSWQMVFGLHFRGCSNSYPNCKITKYPNDVFFCSIDRYTRSTLRKSKMLFIANFDAFLLFESSLKHIENRISIALFETETKIKRSYSLWRSLDSEKNVCWFIN